MSEPDGFADFVRAHTPALVASAYLLTGRSAAAEDLVQDTLLGLYRKWDRVLAAEVPVAYVRRCLVNNFLNSRRSRAGNEILFAEAPDLSGPADVATQVGDRDLVRRLLAGLPHKQRAILVMRFFDDLADDDIAAAVGCRPSTVRSTISRTLASLRTSAHVVPKEARS